MHFNLKAAWGAECKEYGIEVYREPNSIQSDTRELASELAFVPLQWIGMSFPWPQEITMQIRSSDECNDTKSHHTKVQNE